MLTDDSKSDLYSIFKFQIPWGYEFSYFNYSVSNRVLREIIGDMSVLISVFGDNLIGWGGGYIIFREK